MNDKIKNGVHEMSVPKSYVAPKDPMVAKSLEQFQDMKLGFMIHFAPYVQLGIMASWPLCDELKNNQWSQQKIDWTDDMHEFKKQYWDLASSFNPGCLDPNRFAASVESMGFKYVLLPTKHHDGFCMWDTKYSDYRITNPNFSFATHKYADIFGSLTQACQEQNLKIGAYFSKPDWNHEGFWSDTYKLSTECERMPDYDVTSDPERWDRFRKFTENQMLEIVSNYPTIDIMWLDGGQVRPDLNLDIDMNSIASKMREFNEGLIVVDRTVSGENENYLTPEEKIPEGYLAVPWESCMTLGSGFDFKFGDVYKTPEVLTSTFVEILCKGGNLALNVSPQPNGELPNRALIVLSDFKEWLDANEQAIYKTRAVSPYYHQGIGFTKDSDGNVYMFVKPLELDVLVPKHVSVTLDFALDEVYYQGHKVEVKYKDKRQEITMPSNIIDHRRPLYYVFKVTSSYFEENK